MNEILGEFQGLMNGAIKAYNEKNYRTSSFLFSACSDLFRRASEKANSEYVPTAEPEDQVEMEEVKDEHIETAEKQD